MKPARTCPILLMLAMAVLGAAPVTPRGGASPAAPAAAPRRPAAAPATPSATRPAAVAAPASRPATRPAAQVIDAQLLYRGKWYRARIDYSLSRTLLNGRIVEMVPIPDPNLPGAGGPSTAPSAAGGASSRPSAVAASPATAPTKNPAVAAVAAPPTLAARAMAVLSNPAVWVPAVVLAAVLGYFLVLQPRLRRRPLVKALALLAANDPARLPEAEDLLEVALTAGLRPADVDDARFALAYVRARLGRFADAAAVLEERLAKGTPDASGVYLLLWVRCKLKQWTSVDELYEKHGALVGDLLDAKLIAGIACLHRARQFWSRRDVTAAVHYFGRLRELGVLTEEIPPHVDQHEVVLGIMLLFDRKVDEAQSHFEGAVEAARQSGKPTLAGEVGRLLCLWRRCEQATGDGAAGDAAEDGGAVASVGDVAAIDGPLAEVIDGLDAAAAARPAGDTAAGCPNCGQRYTAALHQVQTRATCRECKRGFMVVPTPDGDAVAAAGGGRPAGRGRGRRDSAEPERLLDDDDLLRRDVCLWHAVLLLAAWQGLPAGRGLPADQRADLTRRLDRARALDPELADVALIAGLVDYYFAADDEGRATAVKALAAATQADVHVPEVLNLVSREQRVARVREDVLGAFLQLLRRYLADGTVPEALRRQLQDRLRRFPAVAKAAGRADAAAADPEGAAPDLQATIRNRVALNATRLPRLVRSVQHKLDAAAIESIDGLKEKIDKATEVFSKDARTLEQAEHELLATTGEFLLRDEEPVAVAAAAQEDGTPEAGGQSGGGGKGSKPGGKHG